MARQPRPIRQRIALDGGKELRDELSQLGREGEKAFDALKKAVESADSPAARLGKRIDELRDRLRGLAARAQRVAASVQRVGRSFQSVGTAVGSVVRRLTLVTAAASAAALALIGVARSGAAAADAAGKQAEGLGLTVEEYGRLQFAAEQSGVQQENFNAALGAFNTRIFETVTAAREARQATSGLTADTRSLAEQWAANATGARDATGALDALGQATDPIGKIFEDLGVDLTDSQDRIRPMRDILFDTIDALRQMEDGAEKAGIVARLFGEDVGRRLLPFVNSGSAGVRALGDEAQRLGLIFTSEQVRIGTALTDALNRLNRARIQVQAQLGLLFAPQLTEGADRLTAFLAENSAAIQAFGRDVVARATVLIADLVAALQGRDADVQTSFILEARDAIVAFGQDVQATIEGIVLPAFDLLLGILDRAAGVINAIFGTEFTGRQLGIALVIGQLLGVTRLFFALLGSGLGIVRLFYDTLRLVAELGPALKSFFGVLVSGARAFLPFIAGLVGWPALIIAGLVAAVAAVVIFWDDIVAAARAAFDFLRRQAPETWEAVSGAARAALGFVEQLLGDLGAAIGTAFDSLGRLASEGFAGVRDAADQAFDFVVELWSSLGDVLGDVWDDVAAAADRLWDRIADLAGRALDRIAAAWRRLQSLISSSSTPSGEGQPALARGGPVLASALNAPLRGPGTTTSDSILGWLSRNEFVVRAKAVQHYGSGFLQRLNALQIPKSRMPGFSLGGLVEGLSQRLTPLMPVPAFAGGGAVLATATSSAGGRPVILQLDGRSFAMTAGEDVAEQLTHTVLAQQRRRTGRMPDWFGG